MKTTIGLFFGGILLMTIACKASPTVPPPAAPAVKVEAPAPTAAPVAANPAPAAARPEEAAAAPAEQGRVASYCPEKQVITSGDQSTPEGTIWLAYKAALKGTSEAADDFFGLFASYHARNKSFVQGTQWPRLIQHVRKYVPTPDKPSFTLCRRVKESGPNSIKIFVQSNDPQKSDPPITLVNEGGSWKIDVFTP